MTAIELAPYRAILRKVGYVLIAIGIVDIGVMIYCIIHNIDYSSSFNIFSVIAGIFLVRGNLRAARIVTWFAALFATALILGLISIPTLSPIDLLVTEFRLDPLSMVGGLVLAVLAIFLLIWIYRQLRSPAVVNALAPLHSSSPPRSAFILGALLVVTLVVGLQLVLHSESAAKAIELAKAQVGSAYQLQVVGLNWTNDRVEADLVAYNTSEIKPVHVEWQP